MNKQILNALLDLRQRYLDNEKASDYTLIFAKSSYSEADGWSRAREMLEEEIILMTGDETMFD